MFVTFTLTFFQKFKSYTIYTVARGVNIDFSPYVDFCEL
jgi:hypothetical protein